MGMIGEGRWDRGSWSIGEWGVEIAWARAKGKLGISNGEAKTNHQKLG